ncbi:MAG TPA: hypothetical protein VIL36_20955 [Acidimicrobiales bacterium]
MTDVLDRSDVTGPPDVPGEEPAAVPRGSGAAPAAATGPEHRVLAATLVGAGAIHAAMAPSHLAESAVEGAGFVAAAFGQILLAGAVLLRPTRRLFQGVAAVSVALLAAWAVSRTAGLPFGSHSGHAESVGLVDGITVALEVVALVVAGALALGARPPVLRGRLPALATAGLALVFAVGAVSSPQARDHAAGAHGEHGAGDDHAMGDDHGAGAGHHGEAEDDLGFSQLSNGHQHERGVEPLAPGEMTELAQQLAVTTQLMVQFPTLGDAEAGGYRRAGPFVPGLGLHYNPPKLTPVDGAADTEAELLSPMLIFDGIEADAPLAGFMFYGIGDTAPEGFAGPNDHWHYHERVCIVIGPDGIDAPFGADLEGVTEQMCTDVGGSFIETTGYMVHVWNVPGYESPDGMFTELNPRITCEDGTYYRIPMEELGDKVSLCRDAA